MSSSPDGAVPATALLARLRPGIGSTGVLLLEGRSGSGKTSLAAWLAPRLGARVLHLEHLYCGWDGLDAAAEVLADRVLPAFAGGRLAEWPTWDWAAGRRAGTGRLRPGGPLVVEGCGALTSASRRFAAVAVVLDVATPVRTARIARRDPPSTLPGHRRWALQEHRHALRHPPVALADLVLRGGVRIPEGPSGGLR
ncbi:ATP-binding protein [Amnibacterium sp.]|uniref:ATP-binding protein n=1 Tax=Amnibacterium sp. TaxID=1872496 RepID=UPI002602A69F|nr:ATP-binding protein [Amnibacterium sp.]MCU1472217.1 ATP-binding protein [Amnibacterium sp.]